MDHIVRYHTADGAEKVEDFGSLDAAISRVEALRNDEGVSDPRLYREVKVEFKTYVRAQVVDDSAPAHDSGSTRFSSGSSSPSASSPASSPDAPVEQDRPTASASSEPPPGSMPLNPQRPTTKINDAASIDDEPVEDEDEDAEGDDGAPRRTLFSRG